MTPSQVDPGGPPGAGPAAADRDQLGQTHLGQDRIVIADGAPQAVVQGPFGVVQKSLGGAVLDRRGWPAPAAALPPQAGYQADNDNQGRQRERRPRTDRPCAECLQTASLRPYPQALVGARKSTMYFHVGARSSSVDGQNLVCRRLSGSSAACRPSASKLQPRAVRVIKRPGAKVRCGAINR